MHTARSDEVVVVVVTYDSAPLVADLVASLPEGMGHVPWRLRVQRRDGRSSA
jgi:N-acetylglucosaminyl-diphospho-decaprenol L-rhamnosyltransferase